MFTEWFLFFLENLASFLDVNFLLWGVFECGVSIRKCGISEQCCGLLLLIRHEVELYRVSMQLFGSPSLVFPVDLKCSVLSHSLENVQQKCSLISTSTYFSTSATIFLADGQSAGEEWSENQATQQDQAEDRHGWEPPDKMEHFL